MAPREVWGLYPAATPQRIFLILNDILSFQSSLHLLAWEIGAWPAKMLGTQTAISSGWIVSFLFNLAHQLPMDCDRHWDSPPSSSSEGGAPCAKREWEPTG